MAICFASAVWFDRRALRIPLMAACAVLFVGISLAAAQWWFVECATVETSLQESVREGAGVLGKPEYAPPGVRFPLVDRIVHSACLLDGFPDASVQREAGLAPAWDGEEASCKSSGWSDLVLIPDPSHLETAMYLPEQRRIAGFADHAGYLILRLRYYPAWRVEVNGIPVTTKAERERGFMAVPVPQGNVQVSVDWTTTGDVMVGRWVCGIALLLVTGLFLLERKLTRAQLDMGTASSFVSTEEPTPPKVEPKGAVPLGRTDRRNTPSGKPPKTGGRKGVRKPRRGDGPR